MQDNKSESPITKQFSKEEFVSRVRTIEQERRVRAWSIFFMIVTYVAGMWILIAVDWRIALGVFLLRISTGFAEDVKERRIYVAKR